LGLDEYDDIILDFDARPYAQRMLSEDFLHELKRASLGQEMVAVGIVCMLVATYLLTALQPTLWRSFIVVLLEPAGWFTLWEGLSQLLFYSKDTKPNLVFYRKMSNAKIGFVSVG